MNKEEKIKQLVERIGIVMESKGECSPIAGRVFAYLLLADPPHKDFYDIQEFLSASKSSISTALKFLMDKGMVGYITFTGDRRRYFRVDFDRWIQNVQNVTAYVKAFNKELREVKEFRETEQPAGTDFLQGLDKIIQFQSDILEAIQTIMANWEARRSEQ